jgi:transcription antitermination factor NusG
MDVEVYSPCRVTFRKRKDRPSSVRRELPLFPGYLLLRFDPNVTHTTTITALSGAHGFVRFGGETCVLQDSVVDALKAAVLVRTDRTFDCIEYRNLPSELEKSLHLIIDMHSEAARKAAFFALLAEGAALARLASRPGNLCYSTVHAA